jgi:hypothetical protein
MRAHARDVGRHWKVAKMAIFQAPWARTRATSGVFRFGSHPTVSVRRSRKICRLGRAENGREPH